MPSWLRTEFSTDGEGAEALAEPLSRRVCQGRLEFATESLLPSAGSMADGASLTDLRVRVCGWVELTPERDAAAARAEILRVWSILNRLWPLPEPSFSLTETPPPAPCAYACLDDLAFVPPNGSRLPGGARRPPLVLACGTGFGTGLHPSTRIALHLLRGLARPGARLLDLGCGTGILMLAWLHAGGGYAHGVDLDEDACRVARENLAANGMAACADLWTGPLATCPPGPPADVLVANLLDHDLQAALEPEDLAAHLKPGATLALSGIREEKRAAFLDFLAGRGWEPSRACVCAGWCGWLTEFRALLS